MSTVTVRLRPGSYEYFNLSPNKYSMCNSFSKYFYVACTTLDNCVETFCSNLEHFYVIKTRWSLGYADLPVIHRSPCRWVQDSCSIWCANTGPAWWVCWSSEGSDVRVGYWLATENGKANRKIRLRAVFVAANQIRFSLELKAGMCSGKWANHYTNFNKVYSYVIFNAKVLYFWLRNENSAYETSSGINIQELLVHIVLQFFMS